MKFRRLPMDVEAVQFLLDVNPWPMGVRELDPHWSSKSPERRFNFIPDDTGGGVNVIYPGDWIVTNQTGERYVVRMASFNASYERVAG